LKTQEKYTCQDCGAKPGNLADLKRFTPGLCRACLAQHAWWDKLDQDHREAILSARQVLARQDAALIDTETTDLDGVVLEVAVIALDGTVLFESLVNPECPVSPDAYERHRISDQELATAPTLPEVWPGLIMLSPVTGFCLPIMRILMKAFSRRAHAGTTWPCSHTHGAA
jgi:hypothetical protein